MLELAELLLYVVVVVLQFLFLLALEGRDEVLEAASCIPGLLLFSLGLLYGADGVLDSLVGSLDNLLGFLLCLVQDLLLRLLYAFQFLLVPFRDAVEDLVRVLYLLQFLVQGPAAADNLPEVPLHPDEFFTGPVFGVLDNTFRQAHLPGEFECEGIAREADVQLEEGLDLGRVELHRSVDHSGVGRRGIELQVGVVGGYHSVDPAFVELRQDSLGYGATGCRLCPGPELVDQDEGFAVGFLEHRFHVLEEGTVGGQVVLQVLVVAYADHDPVEDGKFRSLGRRDGHAPLEHVLEQPCRLQADGLAPGVGAGDQEYAFFRRQGYCDGDDRPSFPCKGSFEERMAGLPEVHPPIVGYDRNPCLEIQRDLCLRDQEVCLPDIFGSLFKVRDIRPDEIAESCEDPLDLDRFLRMEGGDFVLEFDDLGGFHVGCLAGCGSVMYVARDLLLAGAVDRYQQFPVPD